MLGTSVVLPDRPRVRAGGSGPKTDRALFDRLVPAGVLWLPAAGLAHPEATRQLAHLKTARQGVRSLELPFVFAVGRITAAGKATTVREGPLVLAAVRDHAVDEEIIVELLADYARAVLRLVPTLHARLTGSMCTRFLAERFPVSAHRVAR